MFESLTAFLSLEWGLSIEGTQPPHVRFRKIGTTDVFIHATMYSATAQGDRLAFKKAPEVVGLGRYPIVIILNKSGSNVVMCKPSLLDKLDTENSVALKDVTDLIVWKAEVELQK
jgi:hypothetical protein